MPSVAAVAKMTATPVPAAAVGMAASSARAPSDLGGSDASRGPRECQPPVAPAPPLLPCHVGSLLAAAATPSDAAAALAARGGRGRRRRTGGRHSRLPQPAATAETTEATTAV